MNRICKLITIAGAVSVALLTSGCATGETKSTENLLVTAGFQTHPANTAAKQQLLTSLPAGKVSTLQKNGHIYYVYPDLKNNVALVGTQQEYTAYRQLKFAKNISDQNLQAAELNSMPAPGWGAWGGWAGGWGGPWGY
jgi:hypothetical protein